MREEWRGMHPNSRRFKHRLPPNFSYALLLLFALFPVLNRRMWAEQRVDREELDEEMTGIETTEAKNNSMLFETLARVKYMKAEQQKAARGDGLEDLADEPDDALPQRLSPAPMRATLAHSIHSSMHELVESASPLVRMVTRGVARQGEIEEERRSARLRRRTEVSVWRSFYNIPAVKFVVRRCR